MAPPEKIESKKQAQQLVEQYDNFLFDCDGVIWLDEKLIPGVLETIEHLESQGKRFAFVTNNSSKSRDTYIEKFHRLGFKGIGKHLIYPTCYAAASYLKEHLKVPVGAKVWVLGDHGIETELKELGYIPVGGSDPRLDDEFDPQHDLLKVDPDVRAVVVGSTKAFNYMRIATTLQYLLHENKSLPFIGTNIDRSYPGPEGLILPAGGSVVNYMSYTSNRDFIDVGKPSKRLLETILEQRDFDKSKTLMIGDTMYTDIKFGNDGQLGGESGGSLLVLSGGTKLKDLHHLIENPASLQDGPSSIPSKYIESFGHIIHLLSN